MVLVVHKIDNEDPFSDSFKSSNEECLVHGYALFYLLRINPLLSRAPYTVGYIKNCCLPIQLKYIILWCAPRTGALNLQAPDLFFSDWGAPYYR